MNKNFSEILRRIANPFLFGSIIISLCTLSMLLETYVLFGLKIKLDGLAGVVFFATLFLYNFHRLMGVGRIKSEDYGIITGWSARNQFVLLMLAIIGAGGVGIFVFHIVPSILLLLFPLGAFSLLYELPLVRYKHRFNQIRNLWMFKIFMITGVWAIATTLLPALNAGISLRNQEVWLVVAERMVFIFILALCFDARDVHFDVKDHLKTIPVLLGSKGTRVLYRISAVVFIGITAIHYVVLHHSRGLAIAMAASICFTYIIVERALPRRSDYYYLFLVDGMMITQFLFTISLCQLQ
ncbi:MAG: hypothetical protein H0W62_13260 [Chitinophagales bacterium]|nr:hypothetical protein [Chitinophagales bacterium]